MRNPKTSHRSAIGIGVAAIVVALGCVAMAADLAGGAKPAAVDPEKYAEILSTEVLGVENLAECVESQRRYFNRITPPGVSLFQPMLPSVMPFDAANFTDDFLDCLLGEDKNSVAVYPLSFDLNPNTRETLVYNACGKLIATIPAIGSAWTTTKDEDDPARVTLQLDLLPVEDVEPYLYVDERIADAALSVASKSAKGGKATMKSLGVAEFGIADIQTQTNGAVRITAANTNGTGTAEVYSFTVWHTNTLQIVTGTNGIPETNIIWWTASAPYNGVDEAWNCRTTNLVFTNGIAVWEDADISTNTRQRVYSVALRTDTDEDGLTDGAEFFVHHTDPGLEDTDGDGMPDGWEVRYDLNPFANDSLDDPDEDGIPNVYEQFHDANPTNSDAASVTILRVDPAAAPGSNIYANLKAAFTSSVPYSIIEVADGIYSGVSNTYLWFPAHPIMLRSDNGGISRQTVFTYGGQGAAFYLDAQQNSHTIVRGISLRMSGTGIYQYGFWLGPGNYFWNQGAGSAPFFDGVTVETGESSNNIAILCYGPAPEPIIFNNCVFRGKPGKSVPLRGIYALDSSALKIINCSFLDFPSAPYAYGVQLHSIYLAETGLVEMANCLWDSSFSASNPTPPFVKSRQFSSSAPYIIHIADSIMPAEPTWFTADVQTNLIITNALVAMSGHLRAGSAGIDAGCLALTRDDFEGQARDVSPDIGADEYAAPGEGDSDGDGLSDATEVETHGSDPYRADSDSDGLADGVEVADGTDPTDPGSYRFDVLGMATNQTGSSAPVRVCRRWGEGDWNTNTAVVATNGYFGFSVMASNQTVALRLGAFCDFNTNGLPDALEPIYWKTIAVTGFVVRTNFLLKDFDGDLAEDWWEVLGETDPFSSTNYCISISGVLTNLFLDSANYHVGFSLSTNATDMLVATNVSTNGDFAFPHIVINGSNRYVNLLQFDDRNTNDVWDASELYGCKPVLRTSYFHRVVLEPWDYDYDGSPDFWENRVGLCFTNKADALEDPDGDGAANIYEYWFGSDPWTADNTRTGAAIWDAIASVDTQLVGRIPSQSLRIFSVQNHAATNYVRNTNCWAYSYDLTCTSPWNSSDGVFRTATLISPRHVLFAGHASVLPASTFRFVDNNNQVVERQLVGHKLHPTFNEKYPDLAVGLLDSDVPTNQIGFAKVLPSNYAEYLHTGRFIPTLCLDQERKALIYDLYQMLAPVSPITCSLAFPENMTRRNYYEAIGPGDSGNPSFLLLGGKLVLLTVWTSPKVGGGEGTSIVSFKDDINLMMSQLGGGYQLSEIDLSGYQKIRD